jgi:hypothetical protein
VRLNVEKSIVAMGLRILFEPFLAMEVLGLESSAQFRMK